MQPPYRQPLTDDAVTAHDLARRLPAELWDGAVDVLLRDLGDGTCLDVGVGTGAIGGRLSQRGARVAGVDVNATMLAALRRQHPGVAAVTAAADQLPFRDGSFTLVVVAHLLHLVASWRAVLAECGRVVAAGGVIAVNTAGPTGRSGLSRAFVEALRERVELPPMPGPTSLPEVADALASAGWVPLAPVEVTTTVASSRREFISRLQHNPFAWPPGVPGWALAEAAAETHRWVEANGGRLDEPLDLPAGLHLLRFGLGRAT